MIRRLAVMVLLTLTALAAAPVAAGAGSLARARGGAPAAGSPPVSVGIKLLQVPANEVHDPRAYEYIVDHLDPGTTIHREFQVSDLSDTGAQVSVYAAAASVAGGSFQFAPGHTQNEMTTWVKVSRPVLSLRPHQRVTEVVTITVPRGAPAGEQYGVIWAQVGAPSTQGNIKLISRVGIRIYLSVGTGGAPPSGFTLGTPAASRVHGRPVLRVPVRNTGGRAVDIVGSLSLANGPGDLRAGPFRADAVVTLAPGQSGTEVFTLQAGLPNGPWQAQVTLQSGLITKTGQYTVDFAGQVSGATAGGFPWALTIGLATAAVVVLIAVLLIVRSRRRRGRGGSQGPGSPAPAGQGTGSLH